MSFRMLPPTLLLAGLAACAGPGDEQDRPASIDSAVAALAAESAPPLPTSRPERQPLIRDNDTTVARTGYRCLPSTAVFAIYWKGEHPRVVLNFADTQVTLPQVIAASGARYSVDSPPIEWWNKGDSATLTVEGDRLTCGPSTDLVF